MAEWNNNNLAHLHTWFNLTVLGQTEETFPNVGAIKMKELTFSLEIASPEMRAIMAASFAVTLHNLYRDIQKAEYEEGFDKQAAIAAIKGILVDADKTVEDLAKVSDQALQFPWET